MGAGRPRQSLGREFQSLLAGTAISNIGDGVRLTALPLLAAAITNDSEFWVASVTAAQFMPWLVFAPIGGVIVDRADRRRLVLVTQAWRAAVMVGFGALVFTNNASLAMVLVVAFVITVGEILVDPSVTAMVPTIVERKNLDRANSQISAAETVTNELLGGPVGAGLYIANPWLPFISDGLSYASSVLAFRRLPPTPRPERLGAGLRQALAEIPEGIRWIKAHPMLRPWTAGVTVFNVGAGSGFSLFVLLVINTHDASKLVYGVVLALAALGASFGASVAARLAVRFGRPPVLVASAATSAMSLVALAGAPSVWLAAVIWAINGLVSGVSMALGRGYVQRYAKGEILGRAVIGQRMITRTAFVVGALGGGMVAEIFGLRTSFACAGIAQAIALIPMKRGLRHDHD